MTRATAGLLMLSAAALIAGSGAAAQRADRLPPECRSPRFAVCMMLPGAARQDCFLGVVTELPASCRKLASDRAATRAGPLPAGWREEAFGADPLQKIEWIMPEVSVGKAPLLVFVHGGGWQIGDKRMDAAAKGKHFAGKGWAFASTNYRLVPQATVEQQAADIAAAVAMLSKQPGVDPSRIVLMGHSAGAHLAALVASDPTYLSAAGVPMSALRGVILLDGAAYDVGRQLADKSNRVEDMYVQAFSRDPARQARLSPVNHAAAPNAADWLILPIERRADATGQAALLAGKLRAAGTSAEVVPQPGKTHMTINRELGTAGDKTTALVDAFLARLR